MKTGRLTIHLLVYVLALLSLLPLASTVLSSVSTGPAAGERWTIANYRTLFVDSPARAWLINSVFVASVHTLSVVLLSSLAGFALSKYRFNGRRLAIVLIYVTMLMPAQVLLPATRELMNTFGWMNSYAALLVPSAVSVFGVFLYAQALNNVPDELLDAARIDGAGEWRLWWQVALPIVRPMTAAYALLSFVSNWNSLLWPQVVLRDEAWLTLPVGLANLAGLAAYDQSGGVVMAGTVVGVLPVVVIFAILQREFISGLASGAVKS